MGVRVSQRKPYGHVAKRVKAPDCNSGAAGSIPVMTFHASVAQPVEHWFETPVVASSTLAGGTNIFPFRLTAGHRSLKPGMEVRFFQRKIMADSSNRSGQEAFNL